MGIFSGIFGNNDSENDSSSDLLGILDLGGSLDFNQTNSRESVDEDGSSDSSSSSTSLGGDLDVGSLLSSMTDQFSSSDSDGGGFFG